MSKRSARAWNDFLGTRQGRGKTLGGAMSLSSVCLAFALLTQAAAVVAADKAAPSQAAAAPALMVEGSASYRERITLPPGAVLIVKVEDVSLMDAPAKVLAEHQQVLGGKQVPLAF